MAAGSLLMNVASGFLLSFPSALIALQVLLEIISTLATQHLRQILLPEEQGSFHWNETLCFFRARALRMACHALTMHLFACFFV